MVPTPDLIFSPQSSGNGFGPTGGIQALTACAGCSPVPVSPNVPLLHSKPGAAKRLMLDFDGHCFPDSFQGYCPGQTVPFSLDTIKDTNFNAAEVERMRGIWETVAEDYAPFDVDVTTHEPTTWDEATDVRVVFDDRAGQPGDWFQLPGFAGYAYSIGAFSNADPNIAYVWYENAGLTPGPVITGSLTSHEAGHLYGLHHYTEGDASKTSIMRPTIAPSSRNVWLGLGIETLSGKNALGFRTSDHGDTVGTASQAAEIGSSVSATGIIEQMTDVDVIRVNVPIGGMFNGALYVVPRVDSYGVGPAADRCCANLNSKLTLLNSAGNQATDATGALVPVSAPAAIGWIGYGASIAARLNSGTYYLKVASHGALGDLGAYTFVGSRPDPSPMTGAPRVTAVTVRKLASPQGGYLLPCRSGAQIASVPRGGVKQVSISFSEAVSVQQDDLVLKGGAGSGAAIPFTGFAYDSAAATATWSFATIGTSQLLLTLKGTGPTAVVDVSTNALDGEWTNPGHIHQVSPTTSSYPSGNSTAGGDFVFRMTLLAGDFNSDGDVDDADYNTLNANFGTTGTTWDKGDCDGDGDVDLTDFGLMQANYNVTNYRVWP